MQIPCKILSNLLLAMENSSTNLNLEIHRAAAATAAVNKQFE